METVYLVIANLKMEFVEHASTVNSLASIKHFQNVVIMTNIVERQMSQWIVQTRIRH